MPGTGGKNLTVLCGVAADGYEGDVRMAAIDIPYPRFAEIAELQRVVRRLNSQMGPANMSVKMGSAGFCIHGFSDLPEAREGDGIEIAVEDFDLDAFALELQAESLYQHTEDEGLIVYADSVHLYTHPKHTDRQLESYDLTEIPEFKAALDAAAEEEIKPIPDDFSYVVDPVPFSVVRMTVPAGVLQIALREYDKGAACPVVGVLFDREECLLFVEDWASAEALQVERVAAGWPAPFLEALRRLALDGVEYVRITSNE